MSVYRIVLLVGVAIFFPRFVAAQVDKPAELMGAINAAIAYSSNLAPFDVTVEFNDSTEFSRGLEQTMQQKFRLRKSAEREELVWASEYRSTKFFPERNDVTFSSTVIDGSQIFRLTSANDRQISAPTFNHAIESVAVADPAYWGVFDFPLTETPAKKMSALKKIIYREDSKVTTAETERGIKYTLRENRGGGDPSFVYWIWHFELPNYNILELQFDFELNGPRKVVHREEIIWKEVHGKLRPVMIHGESDRVRLIDPDSPNPIEVGEGLTDVQINWRPIPRDAGKVRFTNIVEIKQFIDAGFAK